MWKQLYDSLEKVEYAECKPVKKTTKAALDRFETRSKVRLPKSYREFMLVFGPGELAQGFRIAAPGYRSLGDTVDLDLMNKEGPRNYFAAGCDVDDPKQVNRMVFFCFTIANEYVGWDPQDTTDVRKREYGIYVLWRDDLYTTRVARTFPEFIEKVVMGKAISRLRIKYDKDSLKRFTPAQIVGY